MKILPALLLILCQSLFAMDWPSAQGQIIKNFGWNDNGMPQLGVSFEADGSLKAAENGELLFRRNEGDTASRLPSPLGAWTALDHGDGIISIYSRLNDKLTSAGSVTARQGEIQKGEIIGDAGISGWSSKKGFYFQLFDRREKRWINPSLIIASMEDTRPPVVMSVRLKNTQGQLINPYLERTLSQGRYTAIVDAYDIIQGQIDNPLAPFRIICSLNGSETGALTFETYSARDGSLMAYRNGLVSVRKVYEPFPSYEISDLWLSRGQSSLEIIVQDIAGNVRTVIYRLIIE